ncbi:unnamed protein product [Rhodiola kirilowii]
MKLLSWNCRGLGRPRTVRALRDAIRAVSPQVVCLMETKKKDADGNWLKWKLGFPNGLVVGCRGRSGGLAMLWNDRVNITLLSYSRSHIDVVLDERRQFRLTLFYGEPVVSNRVLGWNLLRRLGEDRNLPWVVVGDFNEVTCPSEVQGGRGRQNWQIENFRRVLEDCNLTDLGFTGYPFTYSNRRAGEAEVRARLDRVVATVDWRCFFPRAMVRHVQSHASDHQVLILDTENRCLMRKKKLFRFEVMWFDHPDFCNMMNTFWGGLDSGTTSWSTKLTRCKEKLRSWNQSSFGNVQKKIRWLKEKLEEVRREDRSLLALERERCISEDLDRWLAREETLWMQRSRTLWMDKGDRNTRFFHAHASHRKQKNWISKLKDSQGALHEDEEKMMEIVSAYFNSLFQSSIAQNEERIDAELRELIPSITAGMNEELLKDISEEEIKRALFSLGPLKAPGIDGFPAIFYQKFWEKLKSSIIREVTLFWSEGVLDGEINRTLITLIPKKKDAERMEDWRPISLCTVAVKIITKILAMRLQPILGQVISPFQSAFIKGRIISDNFVVAHEISHFLKSRRDDKTFYASIKVDMSKAYDRVEWLFLEKLLLKLGFTEKWVNRVMLCVSSVSYQVKVNDQVSTVIKPERGLRQGDPLSPYLFLLCTELLTAKLNLAVIRNRLSGVQICKKAPVVSHLLFADDSIFFIKAGAAEALSLKNIFRQYEGVSGQRINYEKSGICFSRNTPADVRLEVCNVLRMPQVSSHSKYLGLPLVIGQRKTESFKCILEKVWKKITDWKNKLLSAAGREVLVKAVLQAIPVYMMSVYQFPKKVISDMTRLIQQFWWRKEGPKGVSWLSQDTLRKKKCEGGLGFRDLGIFNEAILMKIAWRVAKNPQLLMSKVLTAKYCGSRGILNARMGSSPSHLWRGIMKRLHIFVNCIWWEDDGITCRWKHTSNGEFSVKSAYEVIKSSLRWNGASLGEPSDNRKVCSYWKNFWSTKVPNKVKMFAWRLFHNSLPDALNLRRRGIFLDCRCKLCGRQDETALHVVRDCWWAHAVYKEMGLDPSSFSRPGPDPADWMWSVFSSCSGEDLRLWMVVIWICWKNRNRVWHGLDSWCVKSASFIGSSMLKFPSFNFCPNPFENDCVQGVWFPPGVDTIKINSDGAWNGTTRSAGFGIVARDHLGKVLWTWAEPATHCFCSSEVEGLALLRSLELADKLKVRKAIFEVDSMEVYRAVYMGAGLGEWCFSWLSSALRLLRSNSSWILHFAPRESNKVADFLAGLASLYSWRWLRLDAIPLSISVLV